MVCGQTCKCIFCFHYKPRLGSNEDDVPQATAESVTGFLECLPNWTFPHRAICNDILKLSSRGVTVLAASGDGGVAGGSAEQCTQFDVVFPASCPWLTSVSFRRFVYEVTPQFCFYRLDQLRVSLPRLQQAFHLADSPTYFKHPPISSWLFGNICMT